MREFTMSTECEQGLCNGCPLTTGEWDDPSSCACDCGHEFTPARAYPLCPTVPGQPIQIDCSWCQRTVKPGQLPASHTICGPCWKKYFPGVPVPKDCDCLNP